MVNLSQIVAYLGSLLLLEGTFIPIVSLMGMSVSYFDGDGKILLVFVVAAVVLTVLKKYLFLLIPAVLSLGLLGIAVLNVMGTGISMPLSFVIMALGAVLLVVAALVKFEQKPAA